MAKKPGLKKSYSRDNLLARLLRLSSIIPPAVKETPAALQQCLLKFNFPVPAARCDSERARAVELEPAGAAQASSGNRTDLAFASKGCCHCGCDCCRRGANEWLLPRVGGTFLPLRAPDKRLQVIRPSENCVLGVLSCGYVLSGSGTVKSCEQKRA